MKNNTKKLLCILLAIAAAVCVIFACFMLTKHKQTDSASSAAASVSQFGSVADFDYEAFDYSDGLDENGYWSGIKALDYVTLPEDFGSIALKENDLTPTEDELQQQVDNLLNQYTSSQPVTGRSAQSGDVANIDYTGTVDGVAFTGGTAEGKNGFTALGDIRWNGNKGILMLSYLQDGTRGGSLTQAALTDVSRVVFKATAENDTNLGIKLTGVTVTGFDEKGQAVPLLSNIKTPSLSIAVREGNSYDVNKDGTVDQLDITTCQRWYMADSKGSDWSNASVCDVNGDNKVDIQDLIDILQYLYHS